jgi:hypothetical protein
VTAGRPTKVQQQWAALLSKQPPEPAREKMFHGTRKWRFDLAFVDSLIAVEVDGGGFVSGRHGRGAGIEADCEKFAEALALGWRVLRVTPAQVTSGAALRWLEALLDPGAGRGLDRRAAGQVARDA